MNIQKFVVSIALLTTTLPCFSQTDKPALSNQIKISPFRLIDFINPGLDISYERLHGKLSTQVAVGYMKPILGVAEFDNYQGWRFELEEKYFIQASRRLKMYVSVDAAYLKVNYDYANSFQQDTALNTPVYSDTYHTYKRTTAFNLKWGLQYPLHRFILDFSIGAGVKYKMVERTGLIDPNAIEVKSRHPNIYEITNRPGNYFTVSLPVNVRIGYRF